LFKKNHSFVLIPVNIADIKIAFLLELCFDLGPVEGSSMSPFYSGVTILFSVIMSILSFLLEHFCLLKSNKRFLFT